MNLDQIKTLLKQLTDAVNALSTGDPTPPSDAEAPFGRMLDGTPKFAPAYDACRTMLRAAEREGVFQITALLGGGIKPLAGQMYQDFKPDLQLIEDSIIALGKSVWGRNWLTDLGNRATVAPSYIRMFGFKPVERRPDGVLVEIEA